MTAPLVSIFVQVYRTESFLKRCIESVLSQDGAYPIEVLAIDDHSPDRSWSVLNSFRDDRLTVRRNETNLGASHTANAGYAWGSGKYFMRLDSDDVLRPNFLTSLVPLLESNRRVGLAYGDIAMVDAEDRVTTASGNVERGARPAVGDEFFHLAKSNFIPAAGTLVRREALASLIPVPAQFSYLDWYISLGIAERWHTAYSSSVVSEYRIHADNQHRRMVLDGSGERITFTVLNQLWSNGYRAQEKRAHAGEVYGTNFAVWADKYFGVADFGNARRCYLEAGRRHPRLTLDFGRARRFAGTLIGLRHYQSLKTAARRVARGLG